MRALTQEEMNHMTVAGGLSAAEHADVAAVTGAALGPVLTVAGLQSYAPKLLENNAVALLAAPLATGLGAYVGLKAYHYISGD